MIPQPLTALAYDLLDALYRTGFLHKALVLREFHARPVLGRASSGTVGRALRYNRLHLMPRLFVYICVTGVRAHGFFETGQIAL